MSMGSASKRTASFVKYLLLAVNAGAAVAETDLPDKWFERAKGLEQAEALQKEVKADILLFIASRQPSGPARRSRSFEADFLRAPIMSEFLKDYIKVKLVIPGDTDTTRVASERFHVQYGPRIFVIRPNRFVMPIRIQVGEGDKRRWLPLETFQRNLIIYSSPSYHDKAITAEPEGR